MSPRVISDDQFAVLLRDTSSGSLPVPAPHRAQSTSGVLTTREQSSRRRKVKVKRKTTSGAASPQHRIDDAQSRSRWRQFLRVDEGERLVFGARVNKLKKLFGIVRPSSKPLQLILTGMFCLLLVLFYFNNSFFFSFEFILLQMSLVCCWLTHKPWC